MEIKLLISLLLVTTITSFTGEELEKDSKFSAIKLASLYFKQYIKQFHKAKSVTSEPSKTFFPSIKTRFSRIKIK